MSLNPGGTANYSWNYSNQEREGFSLEMTGTVVSLQEVQAREYNPNNNQPGRPAFWPDGNPKMNIRVGFATPEGQLKSITFMKAGKKQVSGEKPSLHMQLFNLTRGNMMELMGKTVHLWTWPVNPNTNAPWGQGNPRLFGVEEVQGAKYELAMPLPDEYKVPELYANDAVQGGQPVAPQPPMQGQYYAPPTQAYAAQPVQPVQPVPPAPTQMAAPAPTQAPVATAPVPAGMDPAVAQAMQAVGATNVTPVAGEVYTDIPF